MENERKKYLQNIIDKTIDNDGGLLHSAVLKITKQCSDLKDLYEVFEEIIEKSLFVASREFVLLKNETVDNESYIIILKNIAQNLFLPKIEEYMTMGKNKLRDAVFAGYAIFQYAEWYTNLGNQDKAKNILYQVVQMCYYDKELSCFCKDIIIFLLNITKKYSDYNNSKCLKVIDINDSDFELLIKEKYDDIMSLLVFYYENNQFASFLELYNRLMLYPKTFMLYKNSIYDYIGVSKDVFLDKLFELKSPCSLQLYLIIKCEKEGLNLSNVLEVINLKTTFSLYSVVCVCFKYIDDEGDISNNVAEILQYIKSGLKKEELIYKTYDNFNDATFDKGILYRYTIKIFKILCKNQKDVSAFISLISYFNAFLNSDVSFDFNKLKEETLISADWKREYEYILQQYKNPSQVVYIVMNSYLRFFVDIVDFYNRFSEYLENYWFHGQINNKGELNLYQSTLNKDFDDKKYIFHINAKGYEGKINIAFKIWYVENSNIYIGDSFSFPRKYSEVNSKKLIALLFKEKLVEAVYLLKQMKYDNLYSKNKYIYIDNLDVSSDSLHDLFTNLINKYKLEYKYELEYIYMNSFLKTVISPEAVYEILDGETKFLGNINYENNMDNTSEYFYVTPNFYNPNRYNYRIKKTELSLEILKYIQNQMEYFGNSQKNIYFRSVRVSFHLFRGLNGFDINSLRIVLDRIVIEEIDDLLSVLYYSVFKRNQKGIYWSTLVYFDIYKTEYYNGCLCLSDRNRKLFKLYTEFLYKELVLFNRFDTYISWVFKQGEYNFLNPFVSLNNGLFELTTGFEDNLICFIKDDKNFVRLIEELKDCPIAFQKMIFEITYMHFIYVTFEEYEMILGR